MSTISDRRDALDKTIGASSSFKKRRKKISGIEEVEPTFQETMSDQITNYKARLDASGVEEPDSRNALEKLLNLPEDQNFLMDVLEVLDRPANALRGGLTELTEGGDVLEGLKQGITGEEDYYFGDVLRNVGVSDEALFKNPLNGEDVSAADLLGTVADVVVDPTTLIPGGAVVKAGKTASATRGVSKATKALNIAETLGDAAQIGKATNTLNLAKQNLEAVKNATYNQSLLDAVFTGIGGAAKGTAKTGDKLLTKGLNALDARNTKNITKRALAQGATQSEIDDILGDVYKLSDKYSDIKTGIADTFNYKGSLPNNLIQSVRDSENKLETANLAMTNRIQKARNTVNAFAERSNNFKDFNDVDESINILRESKKSKDYDMAYILNKANNTKGSYTIELTKDSAKKVQNQLESLPKVANNERFYTITKDDKTGNYILKFDKTNKAKNTIKLLTKNDDVMSDLKNIIATKPTYLTDEQLSRVNRVKELYKTDSEFKDIYDNSEKLLNDYAKYIKDTTGDEIDFTRITDIDGYIRKKLENVDTIKGNGRGLNKNVYGNKEKGKTSDLYSMEAENLVHDKISSQLAANTKEISRTDKAIENMTPINGGTTTKAIQDLEVKKAKNTVELNERIKLRDTIDSLKENTKNVDELKKLQKIATENGQGIKAKLLKAKIDAKTADDMVKRTYDVFDNYGDVASKNIKNAVLDVHDGKLANEYVKSANSYTNAVKNYEKALSNLAAQEDTTKLVKFSDDAEKAYQKMTKAETAFAIKKVTLENAITNKQLKEVDKLVNNVSSSTKKVINQAKKSVNKTSYYNDLVKENENMIIQLTNKNNKIDLEIGALDPTKEANVKKLQELMDKKAKLVEQKTFLETEQGKKFYTNSYFSGLEDIVRKNNEQLKNVDAYNKIILESGLNDDRIIKFIPKDSSKVKVGKNNVYLSGKDINRITSYLDNYVGLLPDSSKEFLKTFKSMAKESNGIIMNKVAYDMLKLNDSKTAGTLLDYLDSATNVFKKYSTFSPGFQFRSFTGNTLNAWLSGIPITGMADSFNRTRKLLSKDNMWTILSKGMDNPSALKGIDKENYQLVKQFLDGGFFGQGSAVKDLTDILNNVNDMSKYKSKAKQLVDKIFKLNVKGSEWLDSHMRMTVLDYANRHPEYIQKLGVKTSEDAVRFVAFDPGNMSQFEKKYLKKIIPFYTFTKQNLFFQARNLMKNPGRYVELGRALREAYDALDEDQYRDYQKESMQIPLYTDADGNTIMLKTNLPAADLGEWIENPLQKFVSSTSPFIRTPYEAVTGVDTFTGNESNKTGLDYLAGVFGLSNVQKIPERISDLSLDNTAGKNFTDLLGSVASYNDAEKIANSNIYEEYLKYQEYINSLKEQGINVPTITELEEQGIDIDAIRDKINGIDSGLRKIKKKREELQKSLGY